MTNYSVGMKLCLPGMIMCRGAGRIRRTGLVARGWTAAAAAGRLRGRPRRGPLLVLVLVEDGVEDAAEGIGLHHLLPKQIFVGNELTKLSI
jgi:hypothetical protein